MKLSTKHAGFLLGIIALSLLLLPSNLWAQLSGAIFTTKNDGTTVNQNLYDLRIDVYLNGGPQNPNNPGLPPGTYYFQVTNPSGALLLSTDPAVCRQLVVGSTGRVVGVPGPLTQAATDCANAGGSLHLTGQFNPLNGSTPVQLFPFDFTDNPGGEYKAWLIAQTTSTLIDQNDPKVISFSQSDTKTDNFKVKETAQCPGVVPPCPPPPEKFNISGTKFYDPNVNGVQDSGEPGIPFWKIWISDGQGFTPAFDTTSAIAPIGRYEFMNLDPGTYNVCEVIPSNAPVWVPTTPTSITGITVGPDSTANDFGNVCLGAGGGRTLGFWSNKNGQQLMNDGGTMVPELTLLSSLNLRDAAGNNFDPSDYPTFRTWLLSANAVNMAYMLSAQLAAMELNDEAGLVNVSSLVYAPGCGNVGLSSNFISINDLLAIANSSLGADGFTPDGDPNRSTQECLKNALDNANNNKNFVQAAPCDVNYSGLEPSCVP